MMVGYSLFVVLTTWKAKHGAASVPARLDMCSVGYTR